MQPFFFTVETALCNLNLDYCNMPEFNPSKRYQKNTLCPRRAVVLWVGKSLIKGIKSIADATSL